MKAILYVLGGLAVFVCILALGLGTSWFGLVTQRPSIRIAAQAGDERAIGAKVLKSQNEDRGLLIVVVIGGGIIAAIGYALPKARR